MSPYLTSTELGGWHLFRRAASSEFFWTLFQCYRYWRFFGSLPWTSTLAALSYAIACILDILDSKTNRYTLASSTLNRPHDPGIWISSSPSSFHLLQVRCCRLPPGRCICESLARMVVFGVSSMCGSDAAKVIGPRAAFVSLRLCGGAPTIVGNPICEVVSL